MRATRLRMSFFRQPPRSLRTRPDNSVRQVCRDANVGWAAFNCDSRHNNVGASTICCAGCGVLCAKSSDSMKTACQHARENQNLLPTCILAVAQATHQKEVNRPFETDVKTEPDRLTVRPDQACKGSIQVVAPRPPTLGRARLR